MPKALPKNQKCRYCGHKRKHHVEQEVVVDYAHGNNGEPITETIHCDRTSGHKHSWRTKIVREEMAPTGFEEVQVAATEPVPCNCPGFQEPL